MSQAGQICFGNAINTLNRSRLIRHLGKGSYGSVNLIETPEQVQYAVKYQKYSEGGIKGVSNTTLIELDTLTRLRSLTYVVRLEGICILSYSNELALVLEPMAFSLKEFIKFFDIQVRVRYFPKLIHDYLIASTVLERLNINHYDVTPGNILVKWDPKYQISALNRIQPGNSDLIQQMSNLSLVGQKLGTRKIQPWNQQKGLSEWDTEYPDDPIFKLADFGLSRGSYCGAPSQRDIVTLIYRPPELLACRDRTTFPEIKIDLWSFGITLYEYLAGKHPYYNTLNSEAILSEMKLKLGYGITFLNDIRIGNISGYYPIMANLRQNVPVQILNSIPDWLLNIFYYLLQMNPLQRLNPSQMMTALKVGRNPEIQNYINNLKTPEGPRLIGANITRLIRESDGYESYVTLILTVEILTRFYTSLKMAPRNDLLYSAAAFHLASVYIDDYPVTLNTARDRFGLSGNMAILQIEQEETKILAQLGFIIYNSNLTERLNVLYSRFGGNRFYIFGYLKSLPPSYFTQPLTNWF